MSKKVRYNYFVMFFGGYNMKKVLSLLIILALSVTSLTACRISKKAQNDGNETDVPTNNAADIMSVLVGSWSGSHYELPEELSSQMTADEMIEISVLFQTLLDELSFELYHDGTAKLVFSGVVDESDPGKWTLEGNTVHISGNGQAMTLICDGQYCFMEQDGVKLVFAKK